MSLYLHQNSIALLEQSLDNSNDEFLSLCENNPMIGIERDIVNDRWITSSNIMNSAHKDITAAIKQSIKHVEDHINRHRKHKCKFICLESNSKLLVDIHGKKLISYTFDGNNYFDINHVHAEFFESATLIREHHITLDPIYKDNEIKLCCWVKNKFSAFNLRRLITQDFLLNILMNLMDKIYFHTLSKTLKDIPKYHSKWYDIANSQDYQYLTMLPELNISHFMSKNVIYLTVQVLSGTRAYLNVGYTNDIFNSFSKLKEKDCYFGHKCYPLRAVFIKETNVQKYIRFKLSPSCSPGNI